MCRNIFIFVFFFLFVFADCTNSCFAQTDSVPVIPITIGDLEKYKNLNEDEQWDFIVDFYKKNKEKDVTDDEILNELLKLDVEDGKNSDIIQKLSTFGKRYQDMEHFSRNILERINMNILEKNPGRTDLMVDFDNSDTWENIKYFKIGKRDINSYLKLFKKDQYFSETVSAENFSAVLASCADKGSGKLLMSFILLPGEDYTILTQIDGEVPVNVEIDFTGSENVEFDSIYPPFEKSFTVGGKKAFGYDTTVYLPFLVQLKDKKAPGIVKAVLSAYLCKNGICHKQTTKTITYETKQSSLDAPNCAKITQEFVAAPRSQKSGLELKETYFKKEENGEVNLFVVLKLPFLGGKKPDILIKNDQGLKFSTPLVSWDSKDMLLKFRLLNPEKLQEKAEMILDIGYPGRASEFVLSAKVEEQPPKPFLSFFSFSIMDFFVAFLSGIKFLFLTPVLTAFLMLGYQAAFTDKKSPEQTVFFYNGLGNMFYFWCLIGVFFVLLWFYAVPSGVFFWGKQFLSPMMNFVFMMLFVFLALSIYKVFDDISIVLTAERFSKVFSVFQPEDIREKAGLIVGFITGCLLFITPMTGMYYDLYVLLSRSMILYSLAFAAGLSLPFLVLSFYDNRAAKIEVNERLQRQVKAILPIPLYLQALLLAILIGIQAGLTVFCIAVGLAILTIALLKRWPLLKKMPAFAILVLAGMIFIPFLPNENNLDTRGGEPFNESLLRRRIQEGKSVYLNVTESFCLSCQWNRFIMAVRGAPKKIQSGELSIMRIGYEDPFLKRLLSQGGKYGLPFNMIFSPTYPEGAVVDPVLNPWTAQEAVMDIVNQPENEPDPRTAPEQNQPDPARKDTD